MILAFTLSFGGLELALKTLLMGTAYAIWTELPPVAFLPGCYFSVNRDWRNSSAVILGATLGLKLIS